ncbi:MAG: asparagine synthase (glutamine-hydrolyzing) [Acidobacteria bacterium]|nr:asparagine synthase (glutamine-hydrolyzing) [Acidobacteriota bacterium]
MCGITGIYDYGSESPRPDPGLLTAMRESLHHRGPDDEGFYFSPDGRLGLGFRRLAIIDLSPAGNQPMSTPDGRYWIIFNGEIYNYRELRPELEARGCRFRSQSDTEVLLYLYQEYGPAMLARLCGMFAFAIWDAQSERLWLARDRIGIKPLYYTFANGRFLFASEIKALLKHPDVRPRLDEEALYHYLTFLTTPAPHTLFAGIYKLPPGHTLSVDRQGHAKLEEYWDVFQPAPAARGESEVSERILELLRESVKLRMVSDVPFGVFLSGGIDSSTNVALMAELMDRPVETFSIGYHNQPAYNEFEYARRVAQLFGTNHHEIIIGEKDFLDFLPQLIHHQDEPIADPVCVPVYFVAKLAKDNGVTVCQVGEGSDELFAYPQWITILRLHQLSRFYRLWPRPLRRLALSAVGWVEPHHQAYEFLRRAYEDQVIFWGGAEAYGERLKRDLLSADFRRRHPNLSSYAVIEPFYRRFLERSPHRDFFNFMSYLDLHLRLPELLLMRVDKMTMACSVEGRVPFLDHRLVEFALSLPQAAKIGTGEAKYILKKTVRRILPEDIVYRRKVGFSVPLRQWFQHSLGRYTEGKLNGFLRRVPYFDARGVEALLRSRRASRSWFLLNFVLWHERWIEGRDPLGR